MMNETNHTLKPGDYVLATKYDDGDPCDHFCVGYFREMYRDRYIVEDSEGRIFRLNGFRRCEKISRKIGDILVSQMHKFGDKPGPSVWYWRYHPKQLVGIECTCKESWDEYMKCATAYRIAFGDAENKSNKMNEDVGYEKRKEAWDKYDKVKKALKVATDNHIEERAKCLAHCGKVE